MFQHFAQIQRETHETQQGHEQQQLRLWASNRPHPAFLNQGAEPQFDLAPFVFPFPNKHRHLGVGGKFRIIVPPMLFMVSLRDKPMASFGSQCG